MYMIGYLKQFHWFLRDIFKSRKIIFELAKKDFQAKYLGSFLGIIWAFIQPTIYILILWFVFQTGFKTAPVDKFPFILWLMTGMIPWIFFSDGLSSATYSIIDHSYLVKKVVFRVSVLPIVKILSALYVHLFFVGVTFVMFLIYGYLPVTYNVQVFYYIFSGMVLILGISWISSSLIIFLKDVGQIVAMLLQFGFWLTPVFWSPKIMPSRYHAIIKLNPVYYIVEGYRNSFVYKVWFWEHANLTLYFWIVNVFIFVLGALLFRRLRMHFADVL